MYFQWVPLIFTLAGAKSFGGIAEGKKQQSTYKDMQSVRTAM